MPFDQLYRFLAWRKTIFMELLILPVDLAIMTAEYLLVCPIQSKKDFLIAEGVNLINYEFNRSCSSHKCEHVIKPLLW